MWKKKKVENCLPTETGSDRQSNEAEGRSKGPPEDAAVTEDLSENGSVFWNSG